MDPARSGGDICIQACANDRQVAVHAIRNLARVASGAASVRYSQLGFGRTSSTTRDQATPRNLFGFKDGTNNFKSDETAATTSPTAPTGSAIWMPGCSSSRSCGTRTRRSSPCSRNCRAATRSTSTSPTRAQHFSRSRRVSGTAIHRLTGVRPCSVEPRSRFLVLSGQAGTAWAATVLFTLSRN